MDRLRNIFLIFSAALILLPQGVDFVHIFKDHGHKLCDNYAEFHYHNDSLDCELHKFQKHSSYYFQFSEYELNLPALGSQEDETSYTFLNEFTHLSFNLRAPPYYTS